MTPAPKRRWLRFSLRTMFVVVVASAFFAWLGTEYLFVRRRLELCHNLMAYPADGAVHSPTIPYWRTLMGDQAIKLIEVHPADDYELIVWAFPEAIVDPHP